MTSTARFIRVVHESPGRLRLRLRWLRTDAATATALADQLAALRGMIEVSVRPSTGSVLCTFDERQLDRKAIVAFVRRKTRVARVLSRDEDEPAVEPAPRRSATRSSLARALVEAVRGVNTDLLHGTDGRMDLATLASTAFFAAGAAEIGTTRQLPAPPWFNLAWWAFRTFTEFEGDPPPTADGPTVLTKATRKRAVPRLRAVRATGPAS